MVRILHRGCGVAVVSFLSRASRPDPVLSGDRRRSGPRVRTTIGVCVCAQMRGAQGKSSDMQQPDGDDTAAARSLPPASAATRHAPISSSAVPLNPGCTRRHTQTVGRIFQEKMNGAHNKVHLGKLQFASNQLLSGHNE